VWLYICSKPCHFYAGHYEALFNGEKCDFLLVVICTISQTSSLVSGLPRLLLNSPIHIFKQESGNSCMHDFRSLQLLLYEKCAVLFEDSGPVVVSVR